FRQVPLDRMVAAGQVTVAGDPAPIQELLPMLEQPRLDFNIVEP
ncbi:MAG: Alkyl sulfatase C-terminal, partial [Pseudomonadota bacterium]